ncbi:MAG TPA: cytochrome c oxidase assembly protein [Candidatus Dormibacteraeota bacterium]|nr:cytochrome c oxidase assembly protein [Candidatus Dormibacteraeota bacterium]
MLPSPGTVPIDPVLAAGLIAAAAVATFSARAAGAEHRGAWRRAAGWTATLLLAAAWLSPLQTLASHYLLTAHLLQITLVMGVIPPLLLLALPSRPTIALPRVLRWAGRALVHPICGIVAINVAFFGWHLTGAYDASLRNQELYALQQITLLAASLLFWWPIVAPLGEPRVLSRWATLGYILVATIPQTFGGITVALAKHALYPTYALAPRVFGISVLTDQQIAGACIALVSKIALFTAFSVVFLRMLNEAPEDGGDDGGGGGGRRRDSDTPSPRPSGSVAWLAELNAGRTVPEPAPARARIRVPAGAGPHQE